MGLDINFNSSPSVIFQRDKGHSYSKKIKLEPSGATTKDASIPEADAPLRSVGDVFLDILGNIICLGGLNPFCMTGGCAPNSPAPPPSKDGGTDTAPILRFAVASDGHYGQESTNYEANYDNLIEWLNRERVVKGLDFAVFNGDLTNNDRDYFTPVKASLMSLLSPYYAVKGNHDISSSAQWVETWGYPDNYDVVFRGIALLLVSTADENGYYICPNTTWLKQKLDQYWNMDVFVFMHLAPEPENGIDCPQTRRELENHANVKATFSGHHHYVDGMKVINGMRYFWDGCFGGSGGGTYRGATYKGYRIVELNNESIRTYAYDPMDAVTINEDTFTP